MTSPADRQAVIAVDDGWHVPIEMPVFEEGRKAGRPVGWLSLNNLPGSVRESIEQDKAAALWRRAAYNAFLRHHVVTGLNRAYIQFEFRFTERREQEPSNFERTIKPIVDALQPLKKYIQNTRKGPRLVIELGIGVIPTDGQKHLVRGPELPVGEPLGRKSRVKGIVIVHLKPLPEPEEA